MTTTAPPLTDMVAVDENSGVQTVGYVTWFSVPDRPVTLTQLKRQWLVHELEESVLPAEPRPLYIFKRAMREQAGKVRNNGSITETDVRLVNEDHAACIYQISRVVRDLSKKVIDYPKAMRVTFDKGTEELHFKTLGGVAAGELIDMEAAISDYFEENTKRIDGRKVRALVRDYLKGQRVSDETLTGLSGENLRGKGGGVYFVKAQWKPQLDALAEALAGMWPDGSAYLYAVPLADGAGAKELLRRHHLNNSMKEAQEAIAEVAKVLRKDRTVPIRRETVEHHWRQLQQLRARAEEYATMLGGEQEDVTDVLEMMRRQLEKLPGAA